jgi:copper homeostasis protein (lipoprotein)
MKQHTRIVAILTFCAAAQGSYVSPAQTTSTPKQEPAASNPAMQLVAQYRGVLPCADCPGIDTTLLLLAMSPKDLAHTSYILKRKYQERPTTMSENGTWSIVRGTPDNSDAIVYQLKPRDGGQPTNFLKVSDNEILQLDSERRRIDSQLNFSLKRVTSKASPVPPPAGF